MASSGPGAARPSIIGAHAGPNTHTTQRTTNVGQTVHAGPGAAGVSALCDIYRQSHGNHVYPLLAAHVMQWCDAFFSVDGHLGTVLHYRFCYDEAERARRLDMLRVFSEALNECYQAGCARAQADFYTTRDGVASSSPGLAMSGGLTAAFALLHTATRAGTPLTSEAKRSLYLRYWRFQMEDIAGVVVRAEMRKIECPVVRALVLQPLLRLAYFPRHIHIAYSDFSNTAEGLAKAARLYDLAVTCGWNGVEATVNSYAQARPETSTVPPDSTPALVDHAGHRPP
jgi:hypothetical protein